MSTPPSALRRTPRARRPELRLELPTGRNRGWAAGAILVTAVVALLLFPSSLLGTPSEVGPSTASQQPSLAHAGGIQLLGPTTGSPIAPATRLQWHQLTNLTTGPGARDRFGMAYDPIRNETVLFGGYNPGTTQVMFNDTWVFRSGAWVHLTPSRAPAPRSGFVLSYDPARNGIVLFGGEDFSVHYSDTWLFNGTTWKLLSTGTNPGGRSQYAMAYDTADREIVLFGGTDGSRDLGDTWAFNATGWHAVVSAHAPQARQFSEMAYDGQDRELVLAGGLNATHGAENGTWAFHAGAWTKLAIHPNPPSEVQSVATTMGNGAALFFSGQSSGGSVFSNSTWVFHHGNWTHTGYPFVPGPRKAGGLAFDTGTGYVLMFGGANAGGWLGDTWELY
jgi:hypothetical protein